MKYKKGTFIVIPNKDSLKGKPSELQSIYLWLCEHSDDNGKSFPTKNTLAEEAGCSHNTLDKYLSVLVEDGMITIVRRKKKGTNENTSNLYQINLVPKKRQPTTKINTTCTTNNGSETNPSVNSNNLITKPPKVEKVFVYEQEMQKLFDSNYKPDKIRWLFFTKKRLVYQNWEQWKMAMKQTIKPAQELVGYNAKQIEATMNYCTEKWQDNWTLFAVVKHIPNIVNIK